MAQVDRFVFLDTAQFVKNEYDNRNKLKLPNGKAQWFGVHLPRQMPAFMALNEVKPANDDWRSKLNNQLFECYHQCSHFQPLMGRLMSIIEQEFQSIAELNMALISFVCSELNIDTATYKVSEYESDMGHKNEQLINICMAEEADIYVTGGGSAGYLKSELFNTAGIEIVYQNYEPVIYPQFHGKFVSNLSVIDLLFNAGPMARHFLMGDGIDT